MSTAEILDSALEAVAGIPDGARVLVGGFGSAGQPVQLIEALVEGGAGDLTVVSNNAGNGDRGLAALIREGRVRKVVCSFPRQSDSWHFDAAWRAGVIELELVPQGTLAERIRAAGATRHRRVLGARQRGRQRNPHHRAELPRRRLARPVQRRHHPGRHHHRRADRAGLQVGHADLPDDVRTA